jgi:23S rRNA pseudouridine2605 synthase
VISTAQDPHGRPTVVDLVPAEPRVHPVGRLDAETEGLLLLTNDGDLTHRLTHPSFGVEKEYLAEVEGVPTRAEVRRLREGVDLDDGPTAPARVAPAPGADGERAALLIVIHEGRNRQVRRMCEAIGHPVRRLVRTRIGPIADRALAPGDWRPLTPAEVRALYGAVTAEGTG